MASLKTIIKTNVLLKPAYKLYKAIKTNRANKAKFSFHGNYIDRSKGNEKLCILLAGYKPYLYECVFGRLIKELTPDIDVCVVTSGKYSEEIDKLCAEKSWSYLSTRENHVGLVQNIAIRLHPNANYIYKLDEDIFLTEGYFDRMLSAYKHAQKGKYNIGVIAPILPVNGYGYARVLEKLHLEDEYEKRFGRISVAAMSKGVRPPIEGNPDIARFFWGEEDVVPGIDEINKIFTEEPQQELPCPIRFSIGAIMFERKLWEDFGCFKVDLGASSMGKDEEQICQFCYLHSRPIMVSENIAVGHFSFGSQTDNMIAYYKEHPDVFSLES